jgi:hypothetical protein
VEERTLEQPAGTDVAAALLDEYLELKEKLGPLERRLDEVRDRLRDLVTEQGHFVDELRGVAVHVEPRFRKEYDPERLAEAFPRLAGCIKPAVDASQLEACVTAGMVTETELERARVLTRTLHSRALIVRATTPGLSAMRRSPASTGLAWRPTRRNSRPKPLQRSKRVNTKAD